MKRLVLRARVPGTATLILALVVLAVLQASVLTARLSYRPGAGAKPVAAAASVSSLSGDDLAAVHAAMKARVEAPRRAKAPARTKAAASAKRGDLFTGLGAWVDVYDFNLDRRATLRRMKANGVRTLYVQTGRYNLPYAVAPEALEWLVAAHEEGLKVVGWYLPGYGSLALDIRRTVAIATVEHRGHRFDGLGIDIEYRGLAPGLSAFNDRVWRHAKDVRRRVGAAYPVASITPSPVQMRVAPGYWAGFPWQRLAIVSDAVMTMSYWSYRKDCPAVRMHCAYGHTKADVQLARRYTGGRVPIHVIGGVGDAISTTEVRDFVRAVRDSGAAGASLYDYRTTLSPFWRHLRILAR